MAQRYDENRDLVHAQIGELENQIRDLMVGMQQRDQRIVQLEAHAAHQQIAAQEADNLAVVGQQHNPVENALKALQTPQILRILPPFDGNPIKLHSFIRSIDDLMPEIDRVRGTPAYTVWLLAIRSKIIEDADSVLEFYGTGTDWDEIKTNLITHYSDKRDEVTLTKDLFKLKQKNKEIEEFYKEIQFALSLMVNQLNLNEPNLVVKNAKNQFYQDMGLKVFLAGLNEPIGQIIRAQCPTSLKDALRRCLEERNFHYDKPKSTPPPMSQRRQFQYHNSYQPPRHTNPFMPNSFKPNQFQFIPPVSYNNQPHRSFQPSQNIPPQRTPPSAPSNPFLRAQRHFQPNIPRSPAPVQFNNFNRPSSHQNSNSFANNLPRPIPMEVDPSLRSRQVNYINRPHFHEMNYTEPAHCSTSDPQYYNPYYDPNNYVCYQDDQITQNDLDRSNTEAVTPESENLNFLVDSEEEKKT